MAPFGTAGGIGCYAACAGSFDVKSSTVCGGGLFCCVEQAQPADGGTRDGGAPLCFGANTSHCCGNDPAGPAECVAGEWQCGSALAPGCNGTLCTAQDGG